MQALDSKIISNLRFLLIVGVVLIHSGIEMNIPLSQYTVYKFFIEDAIIGTVTRVCVPLFFLFSGYLFFANIEKFSKKVYWEKISKRSKSLFIPYLFYNTFAIILFGTIGLLYPQMQSGATPPVQTWTCNTIISLYWDYGSNLPIVPQFWFIRNLMVMVLVSPIIYYLIKKMGCLGVLIVIGLWIVNVWEFGIPGTMGLSFFILGAYLGLKKISLYNLVCKLKMVGGLYPIGVLFDICTKQFTFNIYIHNVVILLGLIFWIFIVGTLLKKGRMKSNNFLADSAFFIFAMHEPYMGKFKHLCYNILPNLVDSQLWVQFQLIFYYFVIAFIWISILVVLFYSIKKISPKFAIFICGGR